MKKVALILFISFLFLNCNKNQKNTQKIINTDVINFWNAFDKVSTTKDSILELKDMNELFVDKASKGQKGMFEARNYAPKEYLDAFNNYPKFWNSI